MLNGERYPEELARVVEMHYLIRDDNARGLGWFSLLREQLTEDWVRQRQPHDPELYSDLRFKARYFVEQADEWLESVA